MPVWDAGPVPLSTAVNTGPIPNVTVADNLTLQGTSPVYYPSYCSRSAILRALYLPSADILSPSYLTYLQVGSTLVPF